MAMTADNNLVVCLLCRKLERHCHGPCHCTIDKIDISVHAAAADCPLGYHSVEGKPPAAQPPELPPPKPIDPVDIDTLPVIQRLAVKALMHFQTPEDAGAGDTLHRLLNDTNPMVSGAVKAFQAAMTAMGWDCGCERRRGEFNQRFPNRSAAGATA